MDNVEEKTTRIRIPDPTGIFKDDPTQEYIRKRNFDDVSEDDDFQSRPWVKAFEFMNDREEIGGGSFGDIKSYIKKCKLQIVVAIITSCKPNVLGDINVSTPSILRQITPTIHSQMISSEDSYAKDIKVGSALILRNVLFCDIVKKPTLNNTIKNLVKIKSKKTLLCKMPMEQV
ncbi:copia protein [Tanacetum coccineum]